MIAIRALKWNVLWKSRNSHQPKVLCTAVDLGEPAETRLEREVGFSIGMITS